MGSKVPILVLPTSLLSGMKSVKMTLILFLAVAGFIEAGPHPDGTMENVNSASPEDDPATEEFSISETADQSNSRTRRELNDLMECYAACREKEWYLIGACKWKCAN